MKKLLLASISTLLLSACASTGLEQSQIESNAQQQALESSITPQEAMNSAQNYLNEAISHQLNFFTPLHFENAQRALLQMEKLQTAQKSPAKTDKKVEQLKEYFKLKELLTQAEQSKAQIQQQLSEALAQKVILDELGVKTTLPKGYQKIEKSLIELFKQIESKRSSDAIEQQPELVKEMIQLEIETLLIRHIKPAQNVLNKAEDNDADDYAEKTFEQAEQAIEASTQYIKVNYKEREQVAAAGLAALVAAQRAYHIGQESHSMINLDEDEAEAKALQTEALIKAIRDAFDAQKLKGLSLAEQARKLAQLAAQQKLKLEQLEED